MKEDSDPIKPSSIQFEPEVHIESVEERGAMPFAETRYSRYLFQRESIMRNAPKASGVYGSSVLSGSTLARLTICGLGSSTP